MSNKDKIDHLCCSNPSARGEHSSAEEEEDNPFNEPTAKNLSIERSLVSTDVVGRFLATAISDNRKHLAAHSLSSSPFVPASHLTLKSCSSNELNSSDLELSALEPLDLELRSSTLEPSSFEIGFDTEFFENKMLAEVSFLAD